MEVSLESLNDFIPVLKRKVTDGVFTGTSRDADIHTCPGGKIDTHTLMLLPGENTLRSTESRANDQ